MISLTTFIALATIPVATCLNIDQVQINEAYHGDGSSQENQFLFSDGSNSSEITFNQNSFDKPTYYDIIPEIDTAKNNILYDSLVENFHQIPEFDSFDEIKPKDYVKFDLLSIPSTRTVIVSDQVSNALFDPNFDPNAKQEVESKQVIDLKSISSRVKKFYQFTYGEPGIRKIWDKEIWIPNNSTSSATYSTGRDFTKANSLNLAISLSRLFGFKPKLKKGFSKSSSYAMELSCTINAGKCLKLTKSFKEFYWKKVTKRNIIVTYSHFYPTEVEYGEYEAHPEIKMIDKFSLTFNCVSTDNCGQSNERKEEELADDEDNADDEISDEDEGEIIDDEGLYNTAASLL